jgi:uncharacterized repeat protein (TIGR03803 family)
MRFVVRFAAVLLCGSCVHVSALQAKSDTVLYSFCSGQTQCTDGIWPHAPLTNINGILYGTTASGGTYGAGTVFSVNPTTGAETVLYSFCKEEWCTDGSSPYAGVTDVNGTLYGTTYGGGQFGYGTVFSINPSTGAELVVYSFQNNGTDGQYPQAGLLYVKGALYGTTAGGGASTGCDYFDLPGCGSVFAIDLTTGSESILHSFQSNGADGTIPLAGLLELSGVLYGSTAYGGTGECSSGYSTGCGTVFSINLDTNTEVVLHSFQNDNGDGYYPYAGLTNLKGTLYGTTYIGGGNGGGSVFSINPETGAETVQYSFCPLRNCKEGAGPYASLTDVDGTLYGTTADGGYGAECRHGYCGTVFAFYPASATETALHSFCDPKKCTDGSNPMAAVIALNGNLYGTTYEGGGSTDCKRGRTIGCGTVYSVKLH